MWIIWVVVILYSALFVYKTKTGSPYLPSEDTQINDMMKYIKKGDVVADIGAGDGRVLIEAARNGAKLAIGYEIEPLVFAKGWLKIKNSKFRSLIKLRFGDMWSDDFSKYDVIFVYQLERFANKFAKKYKREAKKNSIVVSNKYKINGLTLNSRDKDLFIYKA